MKIPLLKRKSMKIIHLADLHLGYRAYNKLSPEGLNIREKDVVKTFKEALDKVSELKPDLVLMAGDIFHKPRPSNSTILLTIKLLHNFRKTCNSPVVLISGNHESAKSLESGSILKLLETTIPKVKVVDGQIEQVIFEDLKASVLCIPYNALYELNKTDLIPAKDYKYNILSMHCSYDSVKCPELSKHSAEELVDSDKINGKEWDYVALGHYHKFTELEDNIYYSGAIERTSSNVWQEAKDPKGFIEYDFETKEIKFHKLETPRKVFDIKRIDANVLTAEEINQKIDEEVVKIKDFENSIIRITLENVDPLAIKNLDYKKIREYRKKAVHFMLNFIKKDVNMTFDKEGNLVEKRKNLHEALEEELKVFELAQGLNQEKFNSLAKEYLKETAL